MLNFVTNNIGTLVVGGLVLVGFILALKGTIKSKKNGGCAGCSGSCSSCSSAKK